MRTWVTILLLLSAADLAHAQESAPATNKPPAAVAPRPVVAATNAPIRVIAAETLRAMLQSTNDFVLVDVMPRLYFQDFHIKGAMSIPEETVAATVQNWPRSRRIVVYCLDRECESSRDVARTLMAMGFADVLQYEGGKREWRARKYEAIGKGRLLD